MPNWVRTRTRIEGPEEQIAKVRAMAELAKKTDAGFFEQFAPKPEGLDDIQVFGDVNDLQKATDDADLFRRFGKQVMKHIDRLEEALQAGAECSFDGFWKSLANLSHACRFKQETGHASWFSWAYENWGTKWDVDGDGLGILDDSPTGITLAWDTAWSLAAPALEKLWRFLDGKCSISGEFADEDIGSNCGTFSVENGECDIEPPEDPVQFALDMWDIDQKEWEEEDD